MTRFTIVALLAALAGPAGTVAAAAQETTGTTPGGAAYRIAVPDGWWPGDGLVLVQHGFSFDPVIDPTLGPIADAMLADGYAVAASGYRQRGWALFSAKDDNAALLAAFRARHGEPGPLVMAGGSMGGLVSLELAEDPRFRDATAGVLAYCPVADGVAAWDTAFDLRLAYDAVCAAADGGDLPRGAEPTPWALDPAQLPDSVDTPEDSEALLLAAGGIARCTGLGIPAPLRTSGMRERLQQLMTVAETDDEEALLQQLAYAVVGLSDLVRAPDKLNGAVPFFNRAAVEGGVQDLAYGPGIDAGVRRVLRDDFARLAFHRTSSLDGSAAARIVSLHTRGDAVVPAWHQHRLAWRYHDDPPLIGIVENRTPVHCGFSAGEVLAGWRVLRAWLQAPAARPGVDGLQRECEAAQAGECRFGPLTGDVPGTARLRSTASDVLARVPRPVGGLWTTPGLPSQGLMIEELDLPLDAGGLGEQRHAVYWYTWAPAGDPEPGPRWLVGVGRVHEQTLYVDDLDEVRGGRFGPALDPATLRIEPWGSLEISFADRPATMRYRGRFGRGERALEQVTVSGLGAGFSTDFSPPPPYSFARAGTYYDPAHPGQGWVVNQSLRGARVETLLVGYTHDPAGRPAWMYGIDADADDGLRFAMTRGAQGGTFEAGAAPIPPFHRYWGEVVLESTACDVGAVAWTSPDFGNGRADVVRLTRPYIKYDPGDCR